MSDGKLDLIESVLQENLVEHKRAMAGGIVGGAYEENIAQEDLIKYQTALDNFESLRKQLKEKG